MIVYTKENTWECGLISLAIALQCDPILMRKSIGHDGSKGGFHPCELTDFALSQGWAMVPIVRNPQGSKTVNGELKTCGVRKTWDIEWIGKVAHADRALLTGHNDGVYHAVAIVKNVVYDPKEVNLTYVRNLTSSDYDTYLQDPVLWTIKKCS
jgi:hypothetical protein